MRGIGLAGQMHGAVLLDAQARVLRPAILWNGGRASAQCAQLEAAEPRSRAITGNLAMVGFTAPKLLWLRLPLTGEAVSDMSDASGTLWLGHMPRLVEGNAPSGELAHDIAQAWGLPGGVVVAGGAVQWASRLTGHHLESMLLEQAAQLPSARRASARLFLPYLSGERTPHNNPRASASLTGLRAEHGPAEVACADTTVPTPLLAPRYQRYRALYTALAPDYEVSTEG